MDILGITETWLNDQITDSMISIPDFRVVRNDRLYGRGGGTCIYVRHGINFIENEKVSNEFVEIQSITLTGERVSQKLKPIIVVLIYRPPRGQDSRCLDYILSYLSRVVANDDNDLLIMGDLNWNMEDESSNGFRAVRNILELYSLEQHIKVSTRITSKNSSLIDLMMSNISNVNFAGCIDYMVSDHYPTFISKKAYYERSKKR